MMRWVHNLNIKHKISVLLLLPFLGLMYFTVHMLVVGIYDYKNIQNLIALSEVSQQLSNTIHELQAERGMSAGYIGSQGQKFSDNLPDKYAKTDLEVEKLQKLVNEFPEDSNIRILANPLFNSLAELGEKRAAVNALTIPLGDMLSYYTGMNTAILTMVTNSALASESKEISVKLTAYSLFLQAKERAGIERAVGANVFGSKVLSENMLVKLSGLVAKQNVMIYNFMIFADAAEKDFYTKALDVAAVGKTTAMRKILLENNQEGINATDSVEWFQLMTEKINQLKLVDNFIGEQVVTSARTQQNTTLILIITVTALLIVIALIIYLARNIIHGLLTGLTAAEDEVKHLADIVSQKSDTTARVSCYQSRDELGTLLDKIQDIKYDVSENLEESRKEFAKNLRIKTALDKVTNNVMLANADREIIYVNEALEKMINESESEIKSEIPSFDAQNLIGTNIDTFHKNPSHQISMLDNLTQSHKAEIKISNLTFALTVSPVIDSEGTRTGTVVEWQNRTDEVAIESEVDEIVEAASEGVLDKKISLEGKSGFFLRLSEGINSVTEIANDAITETNRSLGALAEGNLDYRITQSYSGLFNELKTNANQATERLTEIIHSIKIGADNLHIGAREVATGNNDLNTRTQSQASALEETTASMEQMAQRVSSNASQAKDATTIASEAEKYAEHGTTIANKTVEAMSQINASSQKIQNILGVIDEIAFQTNLLALNAAVEAARAGEQGRGFAVVASEVRDLAQRSATYAKEIQGLISESAEKVTTGESLVNESKEALLQIKQSAQKVNEIISSVAELSSDQAITIGEINDAILQLDNITQQNAALVEEIAVSGEKMSTQASEMRQDTQFFKAKKFDSN